MISFARARRIPLTTLLLFLAACGGDSPTTRFRALDGDETGITFANTISTSEEHDFYTDPFIYNGAGVAVGDVDGDGRVDLFFSGNMVSSRLYRNLGEMHFEDVTAAAGVSTDRWATGASMVDIDGDGDLDIYVSVSGPTSTPPEQRANLLFLNGGDGTFTEGAAAAGVADTGFTTHSVFLDYDRDGDLDLFLLGNSPGEFARGETGAPQFSGAPANPAGFDQLYRNEGDGTFTNVSEAAGILRRLGYGLGVVSADLDRDGWPDLYVSNDIGPADVLYINNRDGTFTDRAAEWLDHTSFAGMGVDVADLTNDGWPEILQVDMSPEALADRKRTGGATTETDLARMRSRGGAVQYNLNTLQLSRGTAPDGRVIFSEVARMAGLAHTEWSWAALMADLDNDGLRDVFITNGYPKAVTDLDYQTNTGMARRLNDQRMSRQLLREMLDTLHALHVPNFAFRNQGNLTFADRSREWRLDEAGYSYGAAYADLDDDGRLDLVVSNIDGPAVLYQNLGGGGEAPGAHHLQVRLEGEGPNTRGIGAKVTLYAGGRAQYVDHTPYRGFMSSVDERIHFGLGGAERVDSLRVVWPDGREQLVRDLEVDRAVTVRQRDAGGSGGRHDVAQPHPPTFVLADSANLPRVEHPGSSTSFDFSLQPLLPHALSAEGPPLAVADVNGDGLEDVFVGGGGGASGTLFLQLRGGGFQESPAGQPWNEGGNRSVWGARFFDANGDSLPDLYLASGGYTPAPGSRVLQDRLFLNRGGTRFEEEPGALPEMRTSTAAVAVADFSGDGRPDLFVGGRVTPGNYPQPAPAYLLRNEGGRFTDVTAQAAPELHADGGMVTAAVWTDFDGDGLQDLVTAGEWMPIRFYRNEGGSLREVTAATGLPPLRGWWYSLAAGDLDGDGDVDLVAGNLGLNQGYTTSAEHPFGVYAADFDEDRTTDVVLTEEVDGTDYPYAGLAQLGRAMEPLAARFSSFESFAHASMEEVFGEDAVEGALHYEVDTFASVWLRNDGGGRFTRVPLPPLAQIAPIHAILVHDANGDGKLDLLLAGNVRATEPNTPPADAGKGLWLRGDGAGGFTPVAPGASGFLAPGEVRDLALVRTPEGEVVLVANHGGVLQGYRVRR